MKTSELELTKIEKNGLLGGETTTIDFTGAIKIGSGSCGSVYQLSDNRIIKIISKSSNKKKQRADDPKWEAIVNAALGRTTYYAESKSYCYILMDDLGTNLNKLIRNKKIQITSVLDFLKISMKITSKVLDTQNNGFSHLDLKPENIMVGHSENGNLKKIQLCDYGFSDEIDQKLTIMLGTPIFLAPEIININEKNPLTINGKPDVFSLGVVLLELLLFKNLNQTVEDIISTNNRSINQTLKNRQSNQNEFLEPIRILLKHFEEQNNPDEFIIYSLLINLIEDMLNKDPNERPSIEEVYSEIAKIRYPLELNKIKNNHDAQAALSKHVNKSKNDIKKTCFEQAQINKLNDADSFKNKLSQMNTEKDEITLKKCKKHIQEAKTLWEKELKMNRKSSDRLSDKIFVANELLASNHWKDFRSQFLKNQYILSRNNSSRIKRIIKAVAKLIPSKIVRHSMIRNTLFYQSQNKKLTNKINDAITMREAISYKPTT